MLPLSAILVFGLLLKATGFLVRDELVLRSLVAVGMLCDIAFYVLQPVPIWQSVWANCLLAVINITLVVFIVFERTTMRLAPEEKELFQSFPTLKPGQFRRVLRHTKWLEAKEDTQIIAAGQSPDKLYFVQADRFEIEKQGRRFAAQGPAFAGELVFLNGGASSASVWVKAGSRYVAFDSAELHRLMKKSAPMNNALIALFGKDLARKVASSVPLEELHGGATSGAL